MSHAALEIGPVKPPERALALRSFVGEEEATARALELESLLERSLREPGGRDDPLAGLLEARRGGVRVGLAWVRVEAGATGALAPPRGESLDTEAAVALARAAIEFSASRNLALVQALLDINDRENAARLAAAGFDRLAEIEFLALSLTQTELTPTAPSHHSEAVSNDLEFTPYRAEDELRMARLVESTYVDTLDCPELNGRREPRDVLAGYRAVGHFAPDHFRFVRANGQDVGCLLMADHGPGGEVAELLYMGLAPGSRGRGWGRQIVQRAIEETAKWGRKTLVLAVDARNTPALSTYLGVGFVSLGLRAVYAASPRGACPGN